MPYGDFSLDPFPIIPDTTRVLMQQGRPLLDSDWNAQAAASAIMLRRLAFAILGPWAAEGDAFKIDGSGAAMTIAPGPFWVNGLVATAKANINLSTQPAFQGLDPLPPVLPPRIPPFALIYLDVWEQIISVNEEPALVEVALGGPDTTVRSEIRWAVRATELREQDFPPFEAMKNATGNPKKAARETVEKFLSQFFAPFAANVTLTAEARHHDTTDACLVAPDARYRGVENQLYRVEVYRGTHDAFGNPFAGDEPPLLVWSRDNGSVTLPVERIDGRSVEVTSLGRDDRTRLRPGDLVQLVDRYDAATGRPRDLVKVTDVSDYRNLVTLKDPVEQPSIKAPAILRRWDGGPIQLDFTGPQQEIDLENDIVVTLHTPAGGVAPRLRTGDYWIIPARTAIGDVIWRKDPATGALMPLKPHGVMHHYAPLAAVKDGTPTDTRTVIQRPVSIP
jgi:hypothetical protein